MRTCEACGREYSVPRGGRITCSYCGYNNASGGHPRSLASLRQIEYRRRQQEASQRQAQEDSYD